MLHVKTGQFEGVIQDPALDFPYEPDHFQKYSFQSINEGHHLLVTAHTGSGKTTIAEYAVAHAIRSGGKVIYTTPIKALSNQIYKDFRHKYPHWDVGIQTGDINMHTDAQVLIMTTEILRNKLYMLEGSTASTEVAEDIGRVRAVIFDEVHYIKDRDRGTVWEESIILMPQRIQMIMLSATLPDAETFGTWVAQTKGVDTDYITTTRRVVPLTHNIFLEDRLVPIMDNAGAFDNKSFLDASKEYSFRPSELNRYITNLRKWELLPAFFFCFSRKDCEKHARRITISLVDAETSCNIQNIFDRKLSIFGDRFNGIGQVSELRALLAKGVGYHHSGLLPVLKEIVEILFSEGLIQILFVTETFAAGVNMPTKTVLFTSARKYDGYLQNFRDMMPEEYLQMAGRAGRRGKDKKGTVIWLPFREMPDLNEIKSMMCGNLSPIYSRFNIDYKFLIRVLKTDNLDVLSFSDKTLLKAETDQYIRDLQSQIQTLRERVDQEVPRVSFTEEEHEICFNAERSKGHRKQYHRFIQGLSPERRAELDLELEEVRAYDGLLESLERTQRELRETQDSVYTHTYELLTFLYSRKFIDHLVSYDPGAYKSKNLTLRGLLANEVNECDAILLTELVCSGRLDSLDAPSIISAVALLLDEKESDRDFVLNPDVYKVMKYLVELSQELSDVEQTHNSQNTEWKVSREYSDLLYVWASEGTITDIMALSPNLHIGNFGRAVLKVSNICGEIIKMSAISQNDLLAKTLEGHEERLIRGVVIPDSLYIR